MSNPLEDVENRKAQMDLGAMAWRIYAGARTDGASRAEGLLIIVAYFRGLIHGSNDNEPDA